MIDCMALGCWIDPTAKILSRTQYRPSLIRWHHIWEFVYVWAHAWACNCISALIMKIVHWFSFVWFIIKLCLFSSLTAVTYYCILDTKDKVGFMGFEWVVFQCLLDCHMINTYLIFIPTSFFLKFCAVLIFGLGP